MKIIIAEDNIKIEGDGSNADIVDLLTQGVDHISQELFKKEDELTFAYLMDNLELLTDIGNRIIEKEFKKETKEQIEEIKGKFNMPEKEIDKKVDLVIKELNQKKKKNDENKTKQTD